jgi:hypothetical protein
MKIFQTGILPISYKEIAYIRYRIQFASVVHDPAVEDHKVVRLDRKDRGIDAAESKKYQGGGENR